MSCTTSCHKPSPTQAHCSLCHITFKSVNAFDKHRSTGICLTPERLGMKQLLRDVYGVPMPEDVRRRLRASS